MNPQSRNTPSVEETVPQAWPGAFGLFKHSKLAIGTNLGTYIGLLALSIVASFIPNLFASKNNELNALYLIMQLLSLALSVLLTGAITYAMIKCVKREKIDLNDALSAGASKFVPLLLQTIALAILLTLSLLLLIVPFFIVLPRVLLSPYYLFDQNLSPIDAIKRSWHETRGHSSKVWGILGVNLLIFLLAATIIGIPVALYFGVLYGAAEAILYFWRKEYGAVAEKQTGPILQAKS